MACGLRRKNRADLGLITSEVPATVAGVFTSNLVKAAPVLLCQEHVRVAASRMRAIVVNSGNANCATGPAGLAASRATAKGLARALGCRNLLVPRYPGLLCALGLLARRDVLLVGGQRPDVAERIDKATLSVRAPRRFMVANGVRLALRALAHRPRDERVGIVAEYLDARSRCAERSGGLPPILFGLADKERRAPNLQTDDGTEAP